MSEEGSFVDGRPYFPFLIVSESDPLAVTVEGSILSDAGTKIENVFLLLQRDECHLPKNELSPNNNRDVDQAWRNLFSFLTIPNQSDSIIVLKDQVGDDGRLLPWSPLWYCQHRHIFFQPSCPRCGFSLEMCYDDDLLTGSGLEPYSTSLKRYLYCSHCLDRKNESTFYVHSLDDDDPAVLKDQKDLISGFGHLAKEGNRNANVPCLGCVSLQACYETERLSVSRVVPVSFYPFFMLVLPAPSIHLLDYVPILAGANFEDLASQLQAKGQFGRERRLRILEQTNLRKSPFPLEKDGRFFLEVLYLKLLLLGELAQIVFPGLDKFKDRHLDLSIDHVWVRGGEPSGLLPDFWNCELKLLGVGIDSPRGPLSSKRPSSAGLYFLGSVWFHVLLVNARQDVSRVYGEITKVFEKLALKEDVVPEGTPRSPSSEIFSPKNIFWNPDDKAVNAAWESHWAKALDLGFLLFKWCMSETSQRSETEFWQKFQEVSAGIKDELYTPETVSVRTSPAADNKAIHEILRRIAEKWRSDSQTAPPVSEVGADAFQPEEPEIDRTGAQVSADLIAKETVILRPEDFEHETPCSKIQDEKLAETVIVKPQTAEPSQTPETAVQNGKDLPETVILDRGVSKAEKRSKLESQPSEIPETVVVSPQGRKNLPSDSDRTEVSPGGGFEQMKETDMKAGKGPAAKKKPINMEDEDEDPPTTVILDPSKTRKEP